MSKKYECESCGKVFDFSHLPVGATCDYCGDLVQLVHEKKKGNPVILVIDDDPETRAVIREFLAPEFRVLEASDCGEGLTMAIYQRPSAILLDLCLPGVGGLALCRALRSNQATQRIPILIVTGMAGDDTRDEALAAGADDFITKPFRRADLVSRIRAKIG